MSVLGAPAAVYNGGDIYGTLIVGGALFCIGAWMAFATDRRRSRIGWSLMALWGIWVLTTSSMSLSMG
jgi:hypothetical protein